MLTHIVWHLLPDVATVESSWVLYSGPFPWRAAIRLGLKWLGSGRGEVRVHMASFHVILHMAGLSRDTDFF